MFNQTIPKEVIASITAKHSPFFIKDSASVFTKQGEVRQTAELKKLVKKNKNVFVSMAGYPVYGMRITRTDGNGQIEILIYNSYTDQITYASKPN